MNPSPQTLAAQIAAFRQELIDKGIRDELLYDLVRAYAAYLFNATAVATQYQALGPIAQ